MDKDEPHSTLKVLVVFITGSIFEWYDFTIFGVLSPVLSKVFFPQHNKTTALMMTFSIFATGFVMRPLGGIFWGHVGDRYGRKKAIVLSIFLMTIATVGIGLLPVGYLSVYLLVAVLLALRLLQGFAGSSEYSGMATFIIETVSPKHYCFSQSFVVFGGLAGMLLGTIIGGAALSLPYANAWRFPFLMSVLLGVAGVYLRLQSYETATFKQMEKQNNIIIFPFKKVMVQYKTNILLLVMMGAVSWTGFYFTIVFYPSFLVHLGLSEPHYLHIATAGLVMALIITPIVGAIADRVNLVLMLSVGIISYMIIPLGVVWTVSYNPSFAFIGQLLLFIPLVLVDPIVVAIVPRLFPANVRYTSVALFCSLGACVFGGTMPIISTYLLSKTHSNFAPVFYLAFIGLISFLALQLGKRRLQHDQITG